MKWIRIFNLFLLEMNIMLAIAFIAPYPYVKFPFIDDTRFDGLSDLWNDRIASGKRGLAILAKYAEAGDLEARFAITRERAGKYYTKQALPFDKISEVPGEGEYYIALYLDLNYLTSCNPDENERREIDFLMQLSADKGYDKAKLWLKNRGMLKSSVKPNHENIY